MRIIKIAIALFAAAGIMTPSIAQNNIKTEMENLKLTQIWDKKFPQSDKVKHSKVTFKNRFGIELAADLYEPKDSDGTKAALAVAGHSVPSRSRFQEDMRRLWPSVDS